MLRQLGARRVEAGVHQLFRQAERRAAGSTALTAAALAGIEARLVRACRLSPRSVPPVNVPPSPRFVCDAGLGGLARWLRAAGFEAHWQPHIEDAELLRLAKQPETVVLTTDSFLLERRVVRRGEVRVFWLPPVLRASEQLVAVLRHFGLRPAEPRCMRCGGELVRVEKAAVAERIPPRTARWLDEYFVCQRCGQLFWRGTHWQRIQAQIDRAWK